MAQGFMVQVDLNGSRMHRPNHNALGKATDFEVIFAIFEIPEITMYQNFSRMTVYMTPYTSCLTKVDDLV
jgi:hypothetical protein